MFQLGSILTELKFNEKVQEVLLHLLELAGCFQADRLRDDLHKSDYPLWLIDEAIEITATDRYTWLHCYDTCEDNDRLQCSRNWLSNIINRELMPNRDWQSLYKNELRQIANDMSQVTSPSKTVYRSIIIMDGEKEDVINRIMHAKKLLNHSYKAGSVYLLLSPNINNKMFKEEIDNLPEMQTFSQCQTLETNLCDFLKKQIDMSNLNTVNIRYTQLITAKPFLIISGKQSYESDFQIIQKAFTENNLAQPQIIVPEEDKLTIAELLDYFRKPFETNRLNIIKPVETALQKDSQSNFPNQNRAISSSTLWHFWRFNQNILSNHFGTLTGFLVLTYMSSHNRLPDISQLFNTGYNFFANSQLPKMGSELLVHGFWAGWKIVKEGGALAYENLPSLKDLPSFKE